MSIHDEEDDHTSLINIEQAHVDYILTAEFDVDAGPIISHQYPEPLGGDVRYTSLNDN
jgi:Docking domain of Afi1 for Arf3 in vesicle trafficking